MNYEYVACRIANGTEAASTSGYGIASRCVGVNVCVDNVNVGPALRRVWVFVEAVWVCVCGGCMGVVSVFVVVDSVVGGLVCGGWIGAESVGTGTLVSAKMGSIWCGRVCTVGA